MNPRRAAAALLLFASLAAHAGVEDDGDPVLLVAKPGMADPRFAKSVVVVTFPQDAGPMGVVLNHPTGLLLGALLEEERPELADLEDEVSFGGPVQPDGILFLFHAAEHPVRALPVVDDIYLSGDGRIFEQMVNEAMDGDAEVERRFFAGYAGWAPGQLDGEVDRGDWLVLPVDAKVLFDTDTDTLWDRLLARGGGQTVRLSPSRRLATVR